MLKVFSFSQLVFFTLLSFFTYSLFSHFFLLISFYPYIGLCHSILFYFILYIFFHFFCFVPLNNPTKPNFFFETIKLMTNIKTINSKNHQKLKIDTTSGFDQIILLELFLIFPFCLTII